MVRLDAGSTAKYITKFHFLAVIWLLSLFSAMQAKAASVTLRVAAWQPPDYHDTLATEAIRLFEQDFPDVKVEWLTIPWGEYWDSIPVQHAAGVAPDVLWVTFGEMDISWVKLGLLEPITRLVDEEYLDDFDEPVVRAATLDGELYYIPTRINFLAWVYNKDLLLQAGLAEPGYSWDWETFLDYARKLTRRAADDTAIVYGTYVDSWPLYLYEFIFGAGGQLFDDPSTILPNSAIYNRDEALEGFSFYLDLVNEHRVAAYPGEGPYSFYDGTIAIWQMGSHVFAKLPELAPSIQFGATLAPRDKIPYVAQGGGTGYAISSQSRHKELAWELIKYLQSTEVLAKIGETDSAIVTRKSARALLDPELWHNRLWLEAGRYYNPVSVVGFHEVLVQPLGDAVMRAVRKEAPYEQILDEAVRQSNLALDKWKER